MKLRVVLRDASGVGEGRALMLVDESGEALPGQRAVQLRQAVDECTTFTVTFAVDGTDVIYDLPEAG